MNNEILFSERQSFKQIWIWTLIFGINIFYICGLIRQVFLGHKFSDNPMSNTMIIVVMVLTFLPTLLFFYIKLETEIKSDGIYVRFFPIHLRFKFYSWDNLNKTFVRKYCPIGEFGGWGIRGLGKNRAFSISGNKGIQLVTKDGSKLLIGTTKPEEVTKILNHVVHLTE